MRILLFALLLLCTSARAFFKLESFLERKRVLVELDLDYQLKKGDRVIFLTQEKQELVGIGKVREILTSEVPHRAVVDVNEILGDNQLLIGDAMEVLSDKALSQYHVPGNLSLVLGDNEKVPAKYKELAYLGVFNAEGHALAGREWLISPYTLQYGLTDRFTVKTSQSLLLDGFANFGFKQRLMRNRYAHVTMNGLLSRQINRSDWVSQVGMIATLPSNGRFQSHIVVNVQLEDINEDNPEVKKLHLFPDSDIRTIYEYVADDWDRYLFGPLFNFDTKTVGGTVSHMWIWDTFHLNLGVGSKDVSHFRFGEKGYYGQFDFFWRF